jgi:hypothetical protein
MRQWSIPALPLCGMRRNAGPMTAQPVSMTERAAPMDAPQPSIDPLLALTAKGMDEVNAVILSRMQSEIR